MDDPNRVEFEEFYEPLQDPVIKSVFELYQSIPAPPRTSLFSFESLELLFTRKLSPANDGQVVYLPTTLYLSFLALKNTISDPFFFLSDFHSLPRQDSLVGVNAPIVASKSLTGIDVDHTSYLIPAGKADIFFPTNFLLTAKIHEQIFSKSSSILTHADFVRNYCDLKETETRNGYNPLLEDYQNMTVFVSKPIS